MHSIVTSALYLFVRAFFIIFFDYAYGLLNGIRQLDMPNFSFVMIVFKLYLSSIRCKAQEFCIYACLSVLMNGTLIINYSIFLELRDCTNRIWACFFVTLFLKPLIMVIEGPSWTQNDRIYKIFK